MYIKAQDKIPLFVYGTLRKGEKNNSLLENSKYLGLASTTDKYTLILDGGVPFLLDIPYTYITGDLYEIDLQTLKNIDALEGHPELYKRKLIETVLPSGEKILASTYFDNIKINETGSFKSQKWRELC